MKHEVIIIASMGRCGSTLLINTLRNELEFITDIENLKNPDYIARTFVKTHDYAPKTLPIETKAIFIFGDPRDVALSSNNPGKVNMKLHYEHLHANFNKAHHFLHEDILNLEKNFDSWMKPQTFPLLTVRYETMWENIGAISEFVGYKFTLPEYIKRENLYTKYPFYDIDLLLRTYNSLSTKVQQAKNIQLWTTV